MLLDVATAVTLGGGCLADVAAVRAQPQLFGPVASDPTVSRLVAALADDVDVAVAAVRGARAAARAAVWQRRRPLAGTPGRRSRGQVIVDIDATLVTAHLDKEHAEPTFKRGFGFAPMCAFVDHGEHGTGETLAIDLRPGKASPWNSADHIATLDNALAQLPSANVLRCWSELTPAPAQRCSCIASPTSGWSTRSGSKVRTPSRPRSRRSRSRRPVRCPLVPGCLDQ